MSDNRRITSLIMIACFTVLITACEAWLIEEPTPLPTPEMPDTPVFTDTPAVPTLPPPSTSPTVTLSPTSPLAATSTSLPGQATQAPASVASPIIAYFVVFPAEANADEPVLLFWDTENGISAAIYRLNLDGTPGRTWSVDVDGSIEIVPRLWGRDEIYVLSVTNGAETVEQETTVFVICPYEWFFTPAPQEGCPEPDFSTARAVSQSFERGRMFWLEESNEIVVLFDHDYDFGSDEEEEDQEDRPPAWIIFDNPFSEGMPVDDPALEVPEGFRQPLRGFGMIWRDNPTTRERLGWAIGDEVEYAATIQYETFPTGEGRYFSDGLGAVILLDPNYAGWQVVAYQ